MINIWTVFHNSPVLDVKINLTRINFYSFFFFSNETTYSSSFSSAVKPIPEFLKNEETTFDLSFRLLSRLKLDSLRHVKNSRKRNT